jgi:flagellin
LSAANSQIRETDIAAESAEFTKAQVLMQAGTAMLSQANAIPQLALSLLG